MNPVAVTGVSCSGLGTHDSPSGDVTYVSPYSQPSWLLFAYQSAHIRPLILVRSAERPARVRGKRSVPRAPEQSRAEGLDR